MKLCLDLHPYSSTYYLCILVYYYLICLYTLLYLYVFFKLHYLQWLYAFWGVNLYMRIFLCDFVIISLSFPIIGKTLTPVERLSHGVRQFLSFAVLGCGQKRAIGGRQYIPTYRPGPRVLLIFKATGLLLICFGSFLKLCYVLIVLSQTRTAIPAPTSSDHW